MTNVASHHQESLENRWKGIYLLGGIATLLTLVGILLDTFAGTASGGNLAALPQTAVDRFAQIQASPLLGLYNLDLLNVINQLVLIPAYVALYAALRKSSGFAFLALVIFLVGTAIFVSANTALPLFELSKKYAAAGSADQKMLLAAAGEAMLARGAHGTTSVFIGFLLPSLAGVLMSCAMLSGGIFNRATAFSGIVGGILISIYVGLVTFVPGVQSMATIFAMPGGLLLMAWMVMFALRLFKLSRV